MWTNALWLIVFTSTNYVLNNQESPVVKIGSREIKSNCNYIVVTVVFQDIATHARLYSENHARKFVTVSLVS